ncbi:MAG: peptidylprolyl isomerase [Nitritalea sp.]
MMKGRFLVLIVLLIGSACVSRPTNSSAENEEIPAVPLLTVDGREVFSDEFLWVLESGSATSQDPDTFGEELQTFIDFQLKVSEALALGLDQTEAFQAEYESLKEELVRPFLIESSLREGEVKKSYDRMQEVVAASHILIQFPPAASQEDSLAVLRMTLQLKERAENGEDFNALAATYSEDPSASENKGRLGYFTALQMVYPFEDAAYNLQIGQISDPVLTNFGYHLIRVEDRKPNPGQIQVSHILLRSRANDPVQEERALRRAEEIYLALEEDPSRWENLVETYSDDPGSKQNGGRLPFISLGSLVPEFERAAFNLQEIGAISLPVRSSFGFHIIRLEDKKPLAPLEEMEAEILSKILRDTRSNLVREQTMAIQKSRFNWVENASFSAYLNQSFNEMGRERFLSHIREELSLQDSVLFTIGGNSYRLQDFVQYVGDNPRARPSGTKNTFEVWEEGFLKQRLDAYERSYLEATHPSYRQQLTAYRSGILMFSLMNERVWQKGINDDAGLKRFYEEHQDDYMWPSRKEVVRVYEVLPAYEARIKKFLQDKPVNAALLDRLENTYLLEEPNAFKMELILLEEHHPWLLGREARQVFRNEAGIFKVGQQVSSTPKKLEETRGPLIRDYQAHLEQEMLEEVRKKYAVEVNASELDRLKALRYPDEN